MASVGSGLTKEQVDVLRGRLEAERSRILRVLQGAKPSTPSQDEQTEFDVVAQRTTELSDQLRVADRERALLEDVQRALAKVDAGTYGLAETTGEAIPYGRLAAVPWARE